MPTSLSIGIQKPIKMVEMYTIQQNDGKTVEGPANTFSLWAWVTRIGGDKDYQRGLTQLSDGYRFRLRFRYNFKPNANYSIIYNGQRHTVVSIEQESEGQFWWIIKTGSKHG